MRRNQRDHAVATEPKPVHPVGQPISASTNSGFNRLPQLSFEVFRPLADPDTAEALTRAVTMIPASGEFTYATQAIRKTDGGA